MNPQCGHVQVGTGGSCERRERGVTAGIGRIISVIQHLKREQFKRGYEGKEVIGVTLQGVTSGDSQTLNAVALLGFGILPFYAVGRAIERLLTRLALQKV